MTHFDRKTVVVAYFQFSINLVPSIGVLKITRAKRFKLKKYRVLKPLNLKIIFIYGNSALQFLSYHYGYKNKKFNYYTEMLDQ